MSRLATYLVSGALAFMAAAPVTAQERSAWQNYILRCTGCHGLSGEGTEIGGVPSFIDSIGIIANEEIGRTYLMHVPGVVNSSLSNREIADVMNFVIKTWSDGAPPFDEAEVIERRRVEVPDVVKLRREIETDLARSGNTIASYPWP